MEPIIGTLLVGLVAKLGGDLIASAAKKMFTTTSATQASPPSQATGFQSALEDARAQQALAVAPSPATAAVAAPGAAAPAGTTNFAAAAPDTAPFSRLAIPGHGDVVAAYMRLDSIQA